MIAGMFVYEREEGRADANRFVGEAHSERIAIDLAVGHDGGHAEITARSQHPKRDFTSVGDQNLSKHVRTSAVNRTGTWLRMNRSAN
ncbi:MAG: hypothetical protein R2843_15245 [Thermomicrobiales bacterium]